MSHLTHLQKITDHPACSGVPANSIYSSPRNCFWNCQDWRETLTPRLHLCFPSKQPGQHGRIKGMLRPSLPPDSGQLRSALLRSFHGHSQVLHRSSAQWPNSLPCASFPQMLTLHLLMQVTTHSHLRVCFREGNPTQLMSQGKLSSVADMFEDLVRWEVSWEMSHNYKGKKVSSRNRCNSDYVKVNDCWDSSRSTWVSTEHYSFRV